MSKDEFVRTFGQIVQGPTWVVENAYAQRPFDDTSDLRLAFQEALFGATPEQQRELMTHYPALGSVAGVDVVHEVDESLVRAREVAEVRGSPARLHARTGWEPSIPLERTLADTVTWWREHAST